MKWEELKKINPYITRALNEDVKENPEAMRYVMGLLYSYLEEGNQGDTSEEDKIANLEELEEGEGRIVTTWKRSEEAAALGIRENILIITYFSASNPGDIEYNNTTVMYISDY